MANEHYREFIEEAFIKPIRSVLIVDDDYPTYDEVLNAKISANGEEGSGNEKAWHKSPDRVKKVIDNFRSRDPSLLVDIHDGANSGTGDRAISINHLHQCDLLVLDYQLDKAKEGDGKRAIEILRDLMSNDHFNLVVVYTQEDIDEIFAKVLLGLLNPSSNLISAEEADNARELIAKGEDEVEFLERHLSDSVGFEQYVHFRRHAEDSLETAASAESPFSQFYVHEVPSSWTFQEKRLVLLYLIEKFEREHIGDRDATEAAESLEWSTSSISWIKSDSIFVAFSKKSRDGDDLLSELLLALSDWCPNPSRLLLSTLKAAIDEHGTVAQTRALSNKHALAYWYKRLLQAEEPIQRWRVDESVSRHSEQLMDTIFPCVRDFAVRLINAEIRDGMENKIEQICQERFKVDLADGPDKVVAALEHNAYVCSKAPEGPHLTTGHVFSMCDEYWLCLSPACDMVPTHHAEWQADAFGDHLPFVAIKLQSIQIRNHKLPKDINSNRYLFIRIENTVQGFCFNTKSGEESAPHIYTLYAEKLGEFDEKSFRFKVLRTEPLQNEPEEITLTLRRHEAIVISQLRYEYALNLMQKLGTHLTRIGLDFSNEKLQA